MGQSPVTTTNQAAAGPASSALPESPSLSDQIRLRIATEVLRKTVPAIMVMVALNLTVVWTGGHGHELRLVPNVVLFLALAVVWRLVRSGRATVAANVFVASLCLAILTGMILNGGVLAMAFAGVIPLLAIIGWLYGVRSAFVFSIAAAVTAGLFVWLDHLDWLRHVPHPTPVMIWIFISSCLVLTFCATALPNRMLHQALADSEARRRELEMAAHDLAERETALHGAEEALRHEKTLTDAIFASMPGVLYLYDDQGRLVRWNGKLPEITGLSDEELSHFQLGDNQPEEDRERVAAAARDVMREGHGVIEANLLTTQGPVPYYFTGVRVIIDGRPHLLGIGIDISERKRAEEHLREALAQAETANRAKDQFLAAASHELRTPLAPALLLASALEADPHLPAGVRGDLATIREHIEVEKRLIGDLLDFTAIHAGKLHIHPVLTDVHDVIRAAVRTCHGGMERKHIRLDVRLDARHHHANGDPDRLRQVFWNLLQNACKFTPEHGAVSVRTDNGGAHTLRVEISDTGRGMDGETLCRLFRPFEQGPRDRGMQHYGGLGLGLAISRTLVKAHGGSIGATSNGPGRGSTFVVSLPVTVHPPLPPVPPEPPAERPAGLKILLVEDHPLTLNTLARLLKAEGHEVTTATTVAEAFRHAEGARFDLLLSDIGLPDGSGLDLMPALRARYGLPGIALSGYGADDDLDASRKAGFIFHLTKPVTIETLRHALRDSAGTIADSSR